MEALKQLIKQNLMFWKNSKLFKQQLIEQKNRLENLKLFKQLIKQNNRLDEMICGPN